VTQIPFEDRVMSIAAPIEASQSGEKKSSRRRFIGRLGGSLLLYRASNSFHAYCSEPNAKDNAWNNDSWDGWMTVNGEAVPGAWERKDGIIYLRKMPERTGHIVTRQEYGDFNLEFEWKIAPGGNSGIKYRVQRYDDRMLGCEYQIYDARSSAVDPKNQTGSIYDLYEPNPDSKANPPLEWNFSRIQLKDDRIEHWLNGSKIVTATIGDADWQRRIAESKFNDLPNFARNPRGRIMLTDHGSEVWYRNIQFTEL
jgi:hypothetical protein